MELVYKYISPPFRPLFVLASSLGLFYFSFLFLQIHPLPLPEEAPDGGEHVESIPSRSVHKTLEYLAEINNV